MTLDDEIFRYFRDADFPEACETLALIEQLMVTRGRKEGQVRVVDPNDRPIMFRPDEVDVLIEALDAWTDNMRDNRAEAGEPDTDIVALSSGIENKLVLVNRENPE